MQSFSVQSKDNNRKIVRIISEVYPGLSQKMLFKALRQKDIKINGVKIKEDCTVFQGDYIEVFIADDLLTERHPLESTKFSNNELDIVYEDENVIIINKPQGLAVHPDRNNEQNTLISMLQERAKKSRNPFIALCHRLDRNTGGLIIAAKNETSLEIMNQKINDGSVKKQYLCIVKGKPKNSTARLVAYLDKDERESRVYIHPDKGQGRLEIITRYKVLKYDEEKDLSLLEVVLETGRTHQIRAHLAYIGHPIIGDGKYGKNEYNRGSGYKNQALWAYKLDFEGDDWGTLSYLIGMNLEVEAQFS